MPALSTMSALSTLVPLAGSEPAGGGPIDQVVTASVAATVVLSALIGVGLARRAGRTVGLDGVERLASRAFGGVPAWAALPVVVATPSLLCAVFGLYWDVSTHIDDGRDDGPLANPSHYFILAGLLGIFAAGWLATVLPRERPGPAAVRISGDWQAPVGGVVMMACASFAALGFPLDDVWHRLFGQDVTLWGPTHLMMLTGAAMTLVGIIVLLAEGRLATARRGRERGVARGWRAVASSRLRLVLACGGLLAGLSIYQGEFDFGVPQFNLLFQPVLIALAASVALVAARLLGGRGAALWAVLFFLVIRGTLTLVVAGPLDNSVAHFPLYLVEALVVEAVALAIGRDRPYRFALAAGAGIATLGVVAEWGWSQVWMPIAWPAHQVPEAIAFALPIALAGGVLGAFLASAVALRREAVTGRAPLVGAVASVAVIVAVFGALLPTSVPADTGATVALSEATPGPDRRVHATVRFDPPAVARDADWLMGMAWQGRDDIVVAPLRRGGDGAWRTTEPLPVHGNWKAMIRLHSGTTRASVPVFLPRDAAIPAAGIPAPARFERQLTADHELLQRERRDGATGWLWSAANIAVLATILALLALLGWALRRVAGHGGQVDRRPGPTKAPAPAGGSETREPAGVA